MKRFVRLARLHWKGLLQSALLVQMSLVVGLAFRFFLVSRGTRPMASRSYAGYTYYSLLAFRNAFIPSLLIGTLVYAGYLKFGRRDTLTRQLISGSVALTVYASIMLLIATLVRGVITFPRTVILMMWAVSIAAFSLNTLTRHMDAADRRLSGFRPWPTLIDAAAVAGSLVLAYLFRFDGSIPEEYRHQVFIFMWLVAALYLASNYAFDVYASIWRFTSLREVLVLVNATAIASLGLGLLWIALFEKNPALRIPLGVLLIHPTLALSGMVILRVGQRLFHQYTLDHTLHVREPGAPPTKVILVGAGEAAQQLLQHLRGRPNFDFVGFLDDDTLKLGRVIAGVRVLGTTQDLAKIARGRKVEEVILTMPAAPLSTVRRIVAECQALGIPTKSVPSLADIVQGNVSVSRLRSVDMEDLLGRPSVKHPEADLLLRHSYHQRVIMVTGAAGSIGSELTSQLQEFEPSLLVLLDKDENGLYETSLRVRDTFGKGVIDVVGDIRDRERLRRVFDEYRPEVVFHAAAYKHVPLMEQHPCEAITNNVRGSRNVAQLSAEFGIGRFVFISTDKAVNPSSVMGASKRVSEMVVQSLAAQHQQTRFCCVRFGNVLGSRASVVPLFRKQLAAGKNLTVTHPDIQRYFMTIPEAVHLVIQAGTLGEHGEVFVLDMGDPVKIVDLAKQLVELSGLRLGEDIEIEFTGLRPGEKLFEELLVADEHGVRSTTYPKIFVAQALPEQSSDFVDRVMQLENAAEKGDDDAVLAHLRQLQIAYEPERSPDQENDRISADQRRRRKRPATTDNLTSFPSEAP